MWATLSAGPVRIRDTNLDMVPVGALGNLHTGSKIIKKKKKEKQQLIDCLIYAWTWLCAVATRSNADSEDPRIDVD